MSVKKITAELDDRTAGLLKAGDKVLITGAMYTARDAAHRRFAEALSSGRDIPVDLNGRIVYYCGPTPAQPGRATGSAGPTTSGRMDAYAPILIGRCGLKGMIGKGSRSAGVVDAMKKHGCVYFAAVGGAGALIARSIISMETVCYEDLGPESVKRIEVRNFPAIVAIDASGRALRDSLIVG